MNIQGLVQISHWVVDLPDGTTKELYLFGDEHVPIKVKCPKPSINVMNLILRVLRHNKDTPIDFYVEADFITNDDKYTTPKNKELTMVKVWRRFKPCMSRDKTNCKKQWRNLRYHYVDIRNLVNGSLNDWFADALRIDLRNLDRDLLYSKIKANGKSIIKYTRTALDSDRVLRQIDSTPEYMWDLFEPLTKRAYGYLENTETLLDKYFHRGHKDFYEITRSICVQLVEANRILMDIYTLGRIFRSFEYDGYTARHILVYAGNNHILEYEDFLKVLGKVKGVKTTRLNIANADGYCQSIAGWDLPKFTTTDLSAMMARLKLKP